MLFTMRCMRQADEVCAHAYQNNGKSTTCAPPPLSPSDPAFRTHKNPTMNDTKASGIDEIDYN